MKKIILYISILIALLAMNNCASPSKSINGGPKDTIAPVVLRELPQANALNVKAKKFEITFDEYVKIKDAKQLTISPPMKGMPVMVTRGKKVIVSFDSALNAETTYLVDFGNGIVDLNEGNPLGNYRLRFSTGEVIDSMHISGRALNAFTYDSVKDVKLLMYTSDVDSLPFTTLPDAVSRVSNKGFFVAEALKNKPYRIIAVEDKNQNNLYDAGETVGFLDSMMMPVTYQADTMTIASYEADTISTFNQLPLVRMFSENISRQFLKEYKREQERKAELYFAQHNPDIRSIEFIAGKDSILLDASKIITEKSFFGDTVTYWFANDSVPAKLSAKIVYVKPDSLGVDTATEAVIKFTDFKKKIEKKEKKKKDDADTIQKPTPLKVSAKINEKTVDYNGFDIVFDAPIVKIDTSKIHFFKYDEELKNKKLVPLSIDKQPDNICIYKMNTPKWETGSTYEIIMDKDAFIDIYNLKNDSISKKIIIPNADRFSVLNVVLTNVTCNLIVQIIKEKQIVQQKQINKNGTLAFHFLDPDMYNIRIIEDVNNNGRWDTGSLKERKQPEKVAYYQLPDNALPTFEVKLRQGWDVGVDIDAKEFFKGTRIFKPAKKKSEENKDRNNRRNTRYNESAGNENQNRNLLLPN